MEWHSHQAVFVDCVGTHSAGCMLIQEIRGRSSCERRTNTCSCHSNVLSQLSVNYYLVQMSVYRLRKEGRIVQTLSYLEPVTVMPYLNRCIHNLTRISCINITGCQVIYCFPRASPVSAYRNYKFITLDNAGSLFIASFIFWCYLSESIQAVYFT